MRIPVDGAISQTGEAAANQVTPVRETRPRPKRSLSDAPTSRNAASVRARDRSVWAVAVHSKAAMIHLLAVLSSTAG